MKQANHSNAKTNVHYLNLINKSNFSNKVLSQQYSVSENTISKWKNRDDFQDKSSRPHNIEYSLSDEEKSILIHLRSTTWWALDEIVETVFGNKASSKRSAVYRLFKLENINTIPVEKKEKAKKFKEYAPMSFN